MQKKRRRKKSNAQMIFLPLYIALTLGHGLIWLQWRSFIISISFNTPLKEYLFLKGWGQSPFQNSLQFSDVRVHQKTVRNHETGLNFGFKKIKTNFKCHLKIDFWICQKSGHLDLTFQGVCWVKNQKVRFIQNFNIIQHTTQGTQGGDIKN